MGFEYRVRLEEELDLRKLELGVGRTVDFFKALVGVWGFWVVILKRLVL